MASTSSTERTAIKKITLFLALLALLALASCATARDEITAKASPTDSGTFRPCVQSDYRSGAQAEDVPGLKAKSDSIVLATATDTATEGHVTDLAENTRTTMTTVEVLHGTSPGKTFTLDQLGSSRQCWAQGADPVRAGQQYLLFMVNERDANSRLTDYWYPTDQLGVFLQQGAEYANVVRESRLPARLPKDSTDQEMRQP